MTDKAQTEQIARREETQAVEMLNVATLAVVESDTQYVSAKTFRQAANTALKNADAMEKSATKLILEGLEVVRSWFRPTKAALKEAKETLDRKITKFELDREKARLAEEARLREKARADQAKLDEKAAALEAKGKPVQAAAAREAAASVVTPAVASTIPKVAGTHHTDVWDIEIIDEKLIPRDYLMVDEAKIEKMVKAMDGQIEIPGVRNFKRRSQASRKA